MRPNKKGRPDDALAQGIYGPPEMTGERQNKNPDEQDSEPVVQGIVQALGHETQMLYGPPPTAKEKEPVYIDTGTMLQGLVQCPGPDLNNIQMAYGPPPMMNNGGFMGIAVARWLDDKTWKCSCGAENTGKFCTECGSRSPAGWLDDVKWRCSCGSENTGKFCPECGSPAPPKRLTDGNWICSCGTVNAGKFCSGCGMPAPDTQK